MDDRVRRALHRLKCPFDNVLSRLRQNLDRDIIGDHILLDQCSQKLVLCLRCRRKSDLDHFESHIDKHLEKLKLLIQAHRLDEGLIPVAQVNAAPDRRFLDRILLYPVVTRLGRHKISLFVFFPISHSCISPYI